MHTFKRMPALLGLLALTVAGLLPPGPAAAQFTTLDAPNAVYQTWAQASGPSTQGNAGSSSDARLLGISFMKPTGAGGEHAQLLMRLTHQAPPSGFTLTLESSEPAQMLLPHTVTVPAGSSAMMLNLTLPKVSRYQTFFITAREPIGAVAGRRDNAAYRMAHIRVAPSKTASSGRSK